MIYLNCFRHKVLPIVLFIFFQVYPSEKVQFKLPRTLPNIKDSGKRLESTQTEILFDYDIQDDDDTPNKLVYNNNNLLIQYIF